MSVSESLNSWFDTHIDSLPRVPPHEDQTIESAIYMLLEGLPVGITEYNVPYRSIPFKRSGPVGWTYFPATDTGSRLARISYRSPRPNVYIRALVKLVDCESDDDDLSYTVHENAVLTIDALTAYGKVSHRGDKQENKRQKLHVRH